MDETYTVCTFILIRDNTNQYNMTEPKPHVKYGRFETINYWFKDGFQKYQISPSARLIWAVLWRNATPDGRVTLSFSRMESESGLGRNTCIRRINELIKKEVIQKIEQGNYSGKLNVYKIRVVRKAAKTRRKRSPNTPRV